MKKQTVSLPVKCLHCNEQMTTPILCEGCHALYPVPQSADYFDLLSIPRSYRVDSGALARAYRSIARRIHPDRFSGDAEEARNLSTRLTAEVNQAYATLGDPVKRAAYMLELAGGPSAVEVRDVPGSLLGEVMMLREAIEQARQIADDVSLEKHRTAIGRRRDQAMKEIEQRADNLRGASDEERKAFRMLLNSIKYFDNLLAELATDPLVVGKGTETGG